MTISVHKVSTFSGRRRELFQTLEVFSTYKVPATVLKIGVEIWERFSLCLLSSQKLLYITTCSTVLVLF